jgi:hypothetical protein
VRRGEFLQWKGRFAEARVDFAAALPALADVTSHAWALRTAHTGVAIADLMAFRVGSAAHQVRAAVLAGETLVPDPLLASAGFEAELLAGAPQQARIAAAREVALFQADGDPIALARAETHLGEALAVLGDSKAARAHSTRRCAASPKPAPARPRTRPTRSRPSACSRCASATSARGRGRADAGARAVGRAAVRLPRRRRGALGLGALLSAAATPRGPALRAEADAFFSPLGAEAIAHRDRVVAWIGSGSSSSSTRPELPGGPSHEPSHREAPVGRALPDHRLRAPARSKCPAQGPERAVGAAQADDQRRLCRLLQVVRPSARRGSTAR